MLGDQVYQFRVRGQLSERTLFELSPLVAEDVQLITVLTGRLDESGARGMVERIHRFGLDLISMERVGQCKGSNR